MHPNTLAFRDHATDAAAVAADLQDCIGQHNLLEGQISLEWRKPQQDCCESIGLHQTVQQWMMFLIKNLLEITHAMWTARNSIAHEKASNGL